MKAEDIAIRNELAGSIITLVMAHRAELLRAGVVDVQATTKLTAMITVPATPTHAARCFVLRVSELM